MTRELRGLLIYGVALIAILCLTCVSWIALSFGDIAGCQIEIGYGIHAAPCWVFGTDISKILTSAWLLGAPAIPVGVVALSIWLLMFVFHIVIIFVRRRS